MSVLKHIYIYIYHLMYRPTYIIFSTGLFRPDIFARPHQEVLVHCRLVHCSLVRCRLKLVLLRILFSDLKADVFSCVGRWKIVLFVCLEKGGCVPTQEKTSAFKSENNIREFRETPQVKEYSLKRSYCITLCTIFSFYLFVRVE